MPLFDREQMRDLAGDQASADNELDLCGVSAAPARIAIERMLERRRFGGPTSVVILIDPATATSGETLFLPIGQQLLEVRKRKHITRFHPLPEGDGGGLYLELPGRPGSKEVQQ